MAVCVVVTAEIPLFSDDFRGKLGPDWTWVRENPNAWRVTEAGLEIHIQPGNMWGGSNDARNVLVRPLPEVKEGALSISVTVSNRPTAQYEQTNLVWYYDDSNMVKIGLELVDGQLSLVMGREQADKTNTVALLPVTATTLHLRLTARGSKINGAYRSTPTEPWREAGECELPVKGKPKLSLQAYQGPADAEHWGKFSELRIEALK